MGWKNVSEHYGIRGRYIVKMSGTDLHIGTPYVDDLISIDALGRVTINRVFEDAPELVKIRDAVQSDVLKYLELIQIPDTFEKSIVVYTYEGSEILEKHCEELGWPNTTHDGALMYDNQFSDDRDRVVGWAINSSISAMETYADLAQEAEAKLARLRESLSEAIGNLDTLKAAYPEKVEKIKAERAARD